MAEYLEKTQILSFFRPSGPISPKCYYHMVGFDNLTDKALFRSIIE